MQKKQTRTKKENKNNKVKSNNKGKNPIVSEIEKSKLNKRKAKLSLFIQKKRLAKLREKEEDSIEPEVPFEQQVKNLLSKFDSSSSEISGSQIEKLVIKAEEFIKKNVSDNLSLLIESGLIDLLASSLSLAIKKEFGGRKIKIIISFCLYILKEKAEMKAEFIGKGILSDIATLMNSDHAKSERNTVLKFLGVLIEGSVVEFSLAEKIINGLLKYVQMGALNDKKYLYYYKYNPIFIVHTIFKIASLYPLYIENGTFDKFFNCILNIFCQGVDRDYVSQILKHVYEMLFNVTHLERENLITLIKETKMLTLLNSTCKEKKLKDKIIDFLGYITMFHECRDEVYKYDNILNFLFSNRNIKSDCAIFRLSRTEKDESMRKIYDLGLKEVIFDNLVNKRNDDITEKAYLSLLYFLDYFFTNIANTSELYREIYARELDIIIKGDASNFSPTASEAIRKLAEEVYSYLFPEEEESAESSTEFASGTKFSQ